VSEGIWGEKTKERRPKQDPREHFTNHMKLPKSAEYRCNQMREADDYCGLDEEPRVIEHQIFAL
jgi:hypothetical protein